MSASDPLDPSSARASRLVAVIDDDPTVRRLMRFWLEKEGYRVVEHASAESALAVSAEVPAAACVDIGIEDMSGLELLGRLSTKDPDLSLIVVTAQRDADTAAEAMRRGAYDYLTKPLERDRLLLAVGRGIERSDLMGNVRKLQSALFSRSKEPALLGRSAPMLELARQIARALSSELPVLICGENGVGKELVARIIHRGSSREKGPFVAVNCAIADEVELFGQQHLASLAQGRAGRFEEAHSGTLFLDDVSSMTPAAQACLLRALEEKRVRRVGGTADLAVDFRLLCSTQRDLRAEVAQGRFREDLYFKLAVYPLTVPPLRERTEDIPLLISHFMQELRQDIGREVERVSPEALEALLRHAWPGNVRELKSVIHRCMLACPGAEITPSELPADVRGSLASPLRHAANGKAALSLAPTSNDIVPLQELERRAIERALKATGGSVGKAAKLLGIGRATLYRRIQSMSLSREVA
jgi:DNA-binding NtrC family response regulator